MKRFSIYVLFLCILNTASAQNGMLDDLTNVCDHHASSKELRLINATALLVANSPQYITYNASSNTYSINTEAMTRRVGDDIPICETSRFYGETHVPGNSGRTGFLIAPDMVMTAPHAGATFTPTHWKIVFRDSKSTAEGSDCTNFTWTDIPASNVYNPIGGVVNTYTQTPTGRYDYAVIKLDRSVVDRQPLKIRRSGTPQVGDILVSAGYPFRGAEKFDTAGVVIAVNAQSVPGQYNVSFPGNDIFYNIHGFEGSSGSPIYNLKDDVVEQVQANATSASWIYSTGAPCTYAAQNNYLSDNNGPIANVSEMIPRNEVLVKPLDKITRVLDLNPNTTLFSTTYSIQSARPEGGEIVSITPIAGAGGDPSSAPSLSLSAPPGNYTIPSEGMNFTITGDIRNLNRCGIWDYELNVRDVTNTFDNIIRHRYEVGVREFSVAPNDEWVIEDLGSPYEQTKTYTIKNVRPTPTHVVVSVDGTLPWSRLVRVNGQGWVSFDLGPTGSSNDSVTFTLSIDPTVAATTSIGTTYRGNVTVYNQPFNCSYQGHVRRYFTFTRGVQMFDSYTQPGVLEPPSGTTFGPPKRFDIDLSNETETCLDSISLDIGDPLLMFGTFEQWVKDLKIVLTSPSGQSGVLWDRQAYPGPHYGSSVVFEWYSSSPIQSLHLDDPTSPPLGGAMLSDFVGSTSRLKGHWLLDISSSGSGFSIVGPVRMKVKLKTQCFNKQ